jgi:hypothetical protein
MSKSKEFTVLVGFIDYSDNNCFKLFSSKIFRSLTYKKKLAAFINDEIYPELRELPAGEPRAAAGRQILSEIGKQVKADYILFLDSNIEPDVDCIEKMLAVNHCIVGGLIASKNDASGVECYNYQSRDNLSRKWLKKGYLVIDRSVDFVSNSFLFVATEILSRVDFSYLESIDFKKDKRVKPKEVFMLEVYKKWRIRPIIAVKCLCWNYAPDGWAYKFPDEVKIWRTI